MRARLLCKTGDLAGSEFQINRSATIGNSSENDIVLQPGTISRKHARIFYDNDARCFMIEDLKSSNGTRVDGMSVRIPGRLGSLHVITFANRYDFIFQLISGQAEAAKPSTAPRAAQQPGVTPPQKPAPAAPPPPRIVPTGPDDMLKTMVDSPVFGTPGPLVSKPPQPPAGSDDRLKTMIDSPVFGAPGPLASKPPQPPAQKPVEPTIKPVDHTIVDQGFTPINIPASRGQDDSSHTNIRVPGEKIAETSPIPDFTQPMNPPAAPPDETRLDARKATRFALEINMPDFQPSSLPLVQGENIIGRVSGCQVTLEFPSISRQHAKITLMGNRAFLEDLNSKNHTFVEGRQISSQTELQPNQEVVFGFVKTRFIVSS